MKTHILLLLSLYLSAFDTNAKTLIDSYKDAYSVVFIDSLKPNLSDTIRLDTIEYMYQKVDDSYLLNLEKLIEQKETEKKIRLVIDDYENNLLKKEMKFDWWSTLPVIRGGILSSTTSNFKNRNVLFEYHESKKWEYATSMIPFAVSWGLKAAGVESRSKTKRMLLANALGLGFTCGITELLKHTADETRPNGHDNHSMPSGHSALAFFSAAVLDREFGHHSPWISVGGYAAALATQYSRIHQNHHYLNDVITGAGIGTMSANLGYFITDKIFGSSAINKPKVRMSDVKNFQKFVQRPTSISLFSGFPTGYNRINESAYDIVGNSQNIQLRTTAGYKTSLELDYFFNSYWAIDTQVSMAQYKVQATSQDAQSEQVYGNNIYQYHFDIGGKYSFPVNNTVRFEARVFAGERLMPTTDFLSFDNTKVIKLKKSNDIEFGAGIGFNMLSTSKYLTGISLDYVHACSNLMKNRWVLGSYWKIIL